MSILPLALPCVRPGRVAAAIAPVRAGDVVRIEGALVDISGPDGIDWKTSLTRTDKGPGACETIYVRAVMVGETRTAKALVKDPIDTRILPITIGVLPRLGLAQYPVKA
jgi:hypothetical protein